MQACYSRIAGVYCVVEVSKKPIIPRGFIESIAIKNLHLGFEAFQGN